jgi:hypothetical protein
MGFFVLTPEDAGHAEPEARGRVPLYVFDTWLGDDLVRAHPLFLATTRLKMSLLTLPAPTGFHTAPVRALGSPFLRSQRPGLRLPKFWILEVYGRAGVHPLGLSADGSLVISQAALERLVEHSVPHAQFAQFVPAPEAAGRRYKGRPEAAGAEADDEEGVGEVHRAEGGIASWPRHGDTKVRDGLV